MIYNEAGEMVTIENPCVYIGESVFDFRILREALETLDDTEYRVILNNIEKEIKECDQKFIDKLDVIKKVDLLSSKSRRLIGIWSGITGVAGAGTIFGSVFAIESHPKLGIVLLIVSGFLFTAMTILLAILANDNGKREKIDMDIIKLAREVIEFYEDKITDKYVPQKIKNEILIKLQGLKSKVDKISAHINNVKIQRELNNLRFNQQMQQIQINNQIYNQQREIDQINNQINMINMGVM